MHKHCYFYLELFAGETDTLRWPHGKCSSPLNPVSPRWLWDDGGHSQTPQPQGLGVQRSRRAQGRKVAGQSEPAATATAVSQYSCSGCRRLSSCHGNCWALLQTQSRASEVRYHALEPSKRKGGARIAHVVDPQPPGLKWSLYGRTFAYVFVQWDHSCLALFISMFGAQSEQTANPHLQRRRKGGG